MIRLTCSATSATSIPLLPDCAAEPPISESSVEPEDNVFVGSRSTGGACARMEPDNRERFWEESSPVAGPRPSVLRKIRDADCARAFAGYVSLTTNAGLVLSLIHISEPTRR